MTSIRMVELEASASRKKKYPSLSSLERMSFRAKLFAVALLDLQPNNRSIDDRRPNGMIGLLTKQSVWSRVHYCSRS
jgi:hypothetical protein